MRTIFRFSVAFSPSCALCIFRALRHCQPQIILSDLPYGILTALHLRLAFKHRAAGILLPFASSNFRAVACGPIYSRR
jgi:hypothetical protein